MLKFGVWLSSCPKKARHKAALLLVPHLGLIRAEEAVRDPGGRCITFHKTLREAQDLANELKALGCSANGAEEASWP